MASKKKKTKRSTSKQKSKRQTRRQVRKQKSKRQTRRQVRKQKSKPQSPGQKRVYHRMPVPKHHSRRLFYKPMPMRKSRRLNHRSKTSHAPNLFRMPKIYPQFSRGFQPLNKKVFKNYFGQKGGSDQEAAARAAAEAAAAWEWNVAAAARRTYGTFADSERRDIRDRLLEIDHANATDPSWRQMHSLDNRVNAFIKAAYYIDMTRELYQMTVAEQIYDARYHINIESLQPANEVIEKARQTLENLTTAAAITPPVPVFLGPPFQDEWKPVTYAELQDLINERDAYLRTDFAGRFVDSVKREIQLNNQVGDGSWTDDLLVRKEEQATETERIWEKILYGLQPVTNQLRTLLNSISSDPPIAPATAAAIATGEPPT